MRFGPWLPLLLLAGLYTALNAARPLLIDDGAYERFSRHIANQPLSPYGFAIFWYEHPQPANEVLAPPVFLYYWAFVRHIVGEGPWLWKVALLPWALLLVASLHALFRRFGRSEGASGGREPPVSVLQQGAHAPRSPGWLPSLSAEWGLTTCVLLSPGLLPSFNLMLDVPALALSLAAIGLFLRAVDRGSPAWATWAGLLAGLAMQTKYSALLAPGAMLLYALLRKRWALGLLAGVMAAQVFVLWELLTALLYGRSHFLLALGDGGPFLEKLEVFPTLTSVLGGAFPLGGLLALAALGVGRRWLALGGAAVALGYVLLALLDVQVTARISFAPWFPGGPWLTGFDLAEPIFHAYSLVAAVAVAVMGWRLVRERSVEGVFLILWLALEVLGYLLLTPFPAVRRVLGIIIVLALLIAHETARNGRNSTQTAAQRALIAASVLLGLGTFLLDWRGAAVHKIAAEEAAQLTQGNGTVWYVGHWGFQYYAERAGMRPVVTKTNSLPEDRETGEIALPSPSHLRTGDWLVVPDARLVQQGVRLDRDRLESVAWVGIGDAVPLTTMSCFYGGRVALQHHAGTRLEVRIYRVTSDFVPEWAEGGER